MNLEKCIPYIGKHLEFYWNFKDVKDNLPDNTIFSPDCTMLRYRTDAGVLEGALSTRPDQYAIKDSNQYVFTTKIRGFLSSVEMSLLKDTPINIVVRCPQFNYANEPFSIPVLNVDNLYLGRIFFVLYSEKEVFFCKTSELITGDNLMNIPNCKYSIVCNIIYHTNI